MAPVQLNNIRYLVAKKETTAGTMVTPVDADFNIRFRDPSVTINIPFDNETSKFMDGYHTKDEALSNMETVEITVTTRLCRGASVSTAPKQAGLWEACGFEEKAYASAGLGYLPRKAKDQETYTMVLYSQEIGGGDVSAYQFAGIMGNMTIGAEKVGADIMCSYTFTGKFVDYVGSANLTLTSPETTLGSKWLNSGVTFSGEAAVLVQSWSLDIGNKVTVIPNSSVSSGVSHVVITDRTPKLTLTRLAKDDSGITGVNPYDLMRGSITQSINFVLNGFGSLNCLDCQLKSNALGDAEGLAAWEQSYDLLSNVGVDGTLTLEDTFELLQGARS